jgi:hypothetical protein
VIGLTPDGLEPTGSDAESAMGATTTPLLTTVTTLGAGMLMLLSGVKKRKLAWRPRPIDRRRLGLRRRAQR